MIKFQKKVFHPPMPLNTKMKNDHERPEAFFFVNDLKKNSG